MYKVILFAGTKEGRCVAEYLQKHGVKTRVCVATEYGERLLPKENEQWLDISHERLDEEEMETLMKQSKDCLVIDATHPYARVVTENIQKACEHTKTAYMRVVREESKIPKAGEIPVAFVEDTKAAAAYLNTTGGNVLLTTGSKELAVFTAVEDYKERCYARVLSLPSVVASCSELGFEGKHLICMQGPFSKELNVAMLRQFDISWMVTKESGNTGGFMDKYEAAKETGCGLLVVGRPRKEEGVTLEACLKQLQERFDWKEEATEQRIALVGIGMGNPDTITVEGKRALEEADLLIGAGRMVEAFAKKGQKVLKEYRPTEIVSYIKAHTEHKNIAVALSGDVGFYSGAKKLVEAIKEQLPNAKRRLIPGISSMVYFCSRLEKEWEHTLPISLHGRERNLLGLLQEHPSIFAIVGNKDGIGALCKNLTSYGMGDTYVWIGERLSYPEEQIRFGRAEEFQDCITDALSVVLFERELSDSAICTHGISDDAFERGKVPMTKEEVRSVSLSKLQLTKNAIVYDVGAGTGSVSVEMAKKAVDGKVYAIEKKDEAVALLKINKKKFAVDNLVIVPGLAPEALVELPAPTHVFVGGSSGNLKEILGLVLKKNPKVRIVINCITLETVSEAMECIRSFSFSQTDIAQIGVAKGKKAGSYHLMMGQNPVYVITCQA